MFFVFALISMASYALHNVWMAPYYRRNDQLAVVTLRGLGMSLAMLPGLLVPGPAGLAAAGDQLNWILAASAAALLGNWAAANTVRYLPIGIATALNMSLSTLVAAGLSLYLLGESLTPGQLVWMGMIFLGVFGLGAVRRPPVIMLTYSLPKGLMFAVLFGLALGVGFTLISRVSRSMNPLVAGWCWESVITLMGAGSWYCGARYSGALAASPRGVSWRGFWYSAFRARWEPVVMHWPWQPARSPSSPRSSAR